MVDSDTVISLNSTVRKTGSKSSCLPRFCSWSFRLTIKADFASAVDKGKHHQNESTRKGSKQLNVTNLITQKLSDSYCTESSASCIEAAASCPIIFVIVLIAGPTECRVTVYIDLKLLNQIIFQWHSMG